MRPRGVPGIEANRRRRSLAILPANIRRIGRTQGPLAPVASMPAGLSCETSGLFVAAVGGRMPLGPVIVGRVYRPPIPPMIPDGELTFRKEAGPYCHRAFRRVDFGDPFKPAVPGDASWW
jgi:hypothetical protein